MVTSKICQKNPALPKISLPAALLILAVGICLDSPGESPVFAQTRVGKNGERFTLYKLRTMVPNADELLDGLLSRNERDGPAFKMQRDPRVTRLGFFLRKTCLDELPQLWNVLRGEMSLVGPRPALPREMEQYDSQTCQRLRVLPGMTCYWQIQPDRNSIPFQDWMELDRKYIRERSLWTDWKIIVATIPAVFRMGGQ